MIENIKSLPTKIFGEKSFFNLDLAFAMGTISIKALGKTKVLSEKLVIRNRD
jgi:hypothetical protein